MVVSDPAISVLTTVHNRERYLSECIESVLASSFSEFEYIIVDDCSTDRSYEVALEYAKRDSRISVHRNDQNLGDYPNRNKAASYARSRFLKYVDADDLIYPHGIAVLIEMMEQFPDAGYGLCSLDQDPRRCFPFTLDPREAYWRNYFDASLFHKAPLSSIIRRYVFDAVGGFPHERMTSDYSMWHLLSRQFPVVLMPGGIVWYRTHDDQEINQITKLPIEYGLRYQNVSIQALLHPGCPLREGEVTEILRRYSNETRKTLLRQLLKGTWQNLPALADRLRRLASRQSEGA